MGTSATHKCIVAMCFNCICTIPMSYHIATSILYCHLIFTALSPEFDRPHNFCRIPTHISNLRSAIWDITRHEMTWIHPSGRLPDRLSLGFVCMGFGFARFRRWHTPAPISTLKAVVPVALAVVAGTLAALALSRVIGTLPRNTAAHCSTMTAYLRDYGMGGHTAREIDLCCHLYTKLVQSFCDRARDI